MNFCSKNFEIYEKLGSHHWPTFIGSNEIQNNQEKNSKQAFREKWLNFTIVHVFLKKDGVKTSFQGIKTCNF
jgi:hypothetical protein